MHVQLKKEDYSTLVRDGHYAPRDGVAAGRLDHVRRIWENQLTRFYVRPALTRLLEQRDSEPLRILDLGCGNGEGWQLLTRIPSAGDESSILLPPEKIGSYLGVDLCADMLRQGRERLAHYRQARFQQADLANPDQFVEPADLYFSSYGSPSHLDDDQLGRLMEGIARKAPSGSVVVLDLLGQYSLEWPCYWSYSRQPGKSRMQPYNMVWLYEKEEQSQRRADFADYRLRFWGGEEVEQFLRNVPVLGDRLFSLERFDRSIFVGRHLDTADFHPGVRPTRRAVNRLFEHNHYTSPSALLIGAIPAQADPFLEAYRRTWNGIVSLFELICRSETPFPAVHSICQSLELPQPLRQGIETLAGHAQKRGWLEPGSPIVNFLEPGLGLLLRQSEFLLQQGRGCGHGLVVVMELA